MYPVVRFGGGSFGWCQCVGVAFTGFVVSRVGAIADAFDDAVGDGLGDVVVTVLGEESILLGGGVEGVMDFGVGEVA